MVWNASFIRGLAQSVLDRARAIRTGLEKTPAKPAAAPAAKVKRKTKRKVATKKKSTAKRKARG